MKGSQAFTLIELLVVVAIIAILAGIIFPVFAQATAKARQVDCNSNLKQLAAALRMYAQDYDEYFPNREQYNAWWFQVIEPYIKNHQVFGCRSGRGAPLTNACLHWTYPQCACRVSYASAYPTEVNGTLSYTYGTDGGSLGLGYNDPDLNPSGKSLAAFTRPSNTILLGDGICLIWHPYHTGWEALYRDSEAAPHHGGRNFAYVDTHVKWVPASQFNGEDFRIR